MKNPYAFIVGCPRSGTTLLQRVLNAHPEIAVIPESHWIPKIPDRGTKMGLTRGGLVTSGIVPILFAIPEFTRLGIGMSDVEAMVTKGASTTYAEFVSGIFDLYGMSRGKTRVGNKTPGFVRRIGDLHALWPKALFIHLVRDGRDVYLSTRDRPLKKPKLGVFDTESDPSIASALWWELNVRAGREAGRSLGSSLYREVRYESFVNSPESECRELCGFLGVRYDEVMLRFNEGETRRRAARPITPGLRDWPSQMRESEVERFEAAAGELLSELGYTRAFQRPRPEFVESALKVRERVTKDPRSHYGAIRKSLETKA